MHGAVCVSVYLCVYMCGYMCMVSGSITWWQIDGETVEMVADFYFLGSKITADGDCSHEIKRRLLLGRKVTTNLGIILKSRDITLPTKVHLVKAMVFSSGHVWMWELNYKESWVLKNWCFWTVVLEKTLESPLDSTEIQPVHLKGNPEYSLEGLMLQLKLQRTHLKRPWCWERLKTGGEGDNRGWDGWMASPTWWTWLWVSIGDREVGCAAVHGVTKNLTQLHDWTKLIPVL